MLNTKCIAAAVNCALWHFFFNLLYLPSLIFFLYNFTFNSFNDDDKDFSIYFFKAAKKSILSVLFFVHEFSWKISRRHVKIAFVLSGRKYSFLTLFLLFFERRLFKRNFSRQEPCIQLLPWFLFYYI